VISFLFWNINQKALQERIVRMVAAFDVDVLLLTEWADVISPKQLADRLVARTSRRFVTPDGPATRMLLVTRLPAASVESKVGGSQLNLWSLKIGPWPGILLAAAHLPAKIAGGDQISQLTAAQIAAAEILRVEEDVGHHRTILVGDLNMNPFEPGIIDATAFHGVMTRDIARRGSRVVRGQPHRFFYNPMWGYFGDRTPGPAGTYYFNASTSNQQFWNIYDQILIRPDLTSDLDEIRIIDFDGEETLLTRTGLPERDGGSDHLPLLFRLRL
jgi:hypothetical protein